MEDRPLEKPHPAMDDALVVLVFLEDVRSRDVRGKEVGRELDAPEREVEGLRERRDEEGLGETGHADEERVPAREEGHQHQVDDGRLPDDLVADGLVELLAGGRGALKKVDVPCTDRLTAARFAFHLQAVRTTMRPLSKSASLETQPVRV